MFVKIETNACTWSNVAESARKADEAFRNKEFEKAGNAALEVALWIMDAIKNNRANAFLRVEGLRFPADA